MVCREIFSRPRKITHVNRLTEIQHKLLHGAIYTGEHLFRFGIVVDNLCSFCKQKKKKNIFTLVLGVCTCSKIMTKCNS